MALKTSLVIAGDASSAVNALDQTDAALSKADAKAQQLSAAYALADKAAARLAGAQVAAKAQTTAAKAAFDAGGMSLKEYNARLIETKSALSLVEAEHRTAVGAVKQLRAANDTVGPSFRAAQAGATNFGRQVQDVAMQLQLGANIGTVIAMQGGQVADAVAQMGGRFAGLAKFMAGPMGTAIIVLTSSLLNMAQAWWQNSSAADENAIALKKVELASDGLSDAQSVLGRMFDLTSGKLQKQNELLRLNAQLQAINMRVEADAARASAEKARDSVTPTYSAFAGAFGMAGAGDTSGFDEIERSRTRVTQIINQVLENRLDASQAIKAVAEKDVKALNITIGDFRKAIVDAVTAKSKGATADAIEASLRDKVLDPALRQIDTSKPKKTRDNSAARAAFGEDTARRIESIRDQYSELPTAVEKANRSMRELDKIVADLERRKPPHYKGLIDDAKTLKPLIEASLVKPFNDYLQKSREAAEVDKLLIAGRTDEAAALRVVLSLKNQIPPLDRDQLAAVLATVQAERQRALLLRDQQALIEANVRAVHDMRGALEQTVADALRGRFSIDNILTSLGTSFINITSQRIVEKMFGDTLRAIEEQARGAGKIDTAATHLTTAMGKGSDAVTALASSIERAIPRIDRATSGTPSLAANDNGKVANDNSEPDDIVVMGKRARTLTGQDASSLLVGMVNGLARDIGIKIPEAVGDGVKSTLSKLEKALPDAMAGAFMGASASRIVLGDRGTGGQIGSAVGGALGQKAGEKLLGGALSSISKSLGSFAGPIGSALGGIVGGLIGGMFKKAPSASAVVSDTSSPVAATGNNAQSKQAVSGVAEGLQASIKQIAKQLGGEVGSFNVSIGQYKDDYRVKSDGSPTAGNKHPGDANLIYNGPDAQAALRIALADAIADGAVKGLSAAVQKALKSTTNVDDAIAEALKVQDLELALGGVGAAIEKEFRSFEATAKERLRLAQAYGFNIVKVEELNARERLALNDKLLKAQVGSLQSLIDEITSGSLYEGSAVDQRKAILEKIDAAKADADAGKDGAADTLARLLQDLNNVSKQVYGTTGGFATDQAAILDAARDTIAKANARVQEAQKAVSDPALAETNRQLDESNDQLARIAAAMNVSVDYLKAIAANSNTADYSALRAWAGY